MMQAVNCTTTISNGSLWSTSKGVYSCTKQTNKQIFYSHIFTASKLLSQISDTFIQSVALMASNKGSHVFIKLIISQRRRFVLHIK